MYMSVGRVLHTIHHVPPPDAQVPWLHPKVEMPSGAGHSNKTPWFLPLWHSANMGAALLAAAQRGDALEVERLVKSGARLRYAKSVRACPARAAVPKR